MSVFIFFASKNIAASVPTTYLGRGSLSLIDFTTALATSTGAVPISAIILTFLPESSQKIWSQLGLDGNVSEESWDSISEIVLDENHKLGSSSPLFAKVEDADIKKYKQKLGTQN